MLRQVLVDVSTVAHVIVGSLGVMALLATTGSLGLSQVSVPILVAAHLLLSVPASSAVELRLAGPVTALGSLLVSAVLEAATGPVAATVVGVAAVGGTILAVASPGLILGSLTTSTLVLVVVLAGLRPAFVTALEALLAPPAL